MDDTLIHSYADNTTNKTVRYRLIYSHFVLNVDYTVLTGNWKETRILVHVHISTGRLDVLIIVVFHFMMAKSLATC